MAKKVKCIECMESMNIALPYRVTKENIDYAKQCLVIAKRCIVCGRTMKTKTREHEQYCKHFEKSLFINDITEEIEQLEAKIKEYEALAEMNKDCTDCRNYWQNTDTENECNGMDKICHEFAEMGE